MKLSLTFVVAMLCAWPASAQLPSPNVSQPTSQINSASTAAQRITLSGCVGNINQSSPNDFILSSAAIVPTSVAPATPTSATPPAVPPVASPTTPATAATPPNPTTPPTSATPGVNAAATQPNAIASDYRLSGLGMSSWSGQRVQVVGVVVPSTTAGSSATTPVGTTGTMGKPMPEFRVQSVQPATGECPPRQ